MRWQMGRRSTNVEDRRGLGGRGIAGLSGGAVIIVALIAILTGTNPLDLLQQVDAHQRDGRPVRFSGRDSAPRNRS